MTNSLQQQWLGYLLLAGNVLFWEGYGWPVLSWLICTSILGGLWVYRFKMLCLSFSVGFIIALGAAIELDGWQFDESKSHAKHLIMGQITAPVSYRQQGQRYVLRVEKLNKQNLNNMTMLVHCYQDCPVTRQGEYWQLLVRLRPPRSRYNPESFDYERWLYSQDIRALGYLLPSTQNQCIACNSSELFLRGRLKEKLAQLFPTTASFASISALLLGDRSELSVSQENLLADAGLSHLIAISGMHVGLAFIPGYFFGWLVWFMLVGRLTDRHSIQWCCGLACALMYCLIAGFAIPAQRAFIMLVALGLATLFRTSINLWSRLGVATACIILLDPRSTLSISFWLSYIVTLFILVFLETNKSKPWLSLLQLQGALALLLPAIQWFYFGQYSLISLLQNLWAIPLLSFIIMPGVILLVVVLLLDSSGSLNQILGWLVSMLDLAFTLFWQLLSAFAQLNQLLIISKATTISLVVIMLFMTSLIWLPMHARIRYLAAIVLLSTHIPVSFQSQLRLRVFDVGQGLAIAVYANGRTLLYDTGYGVNGYYTIAGIWPAWSRQEGVNRIDYLFISHADADHSGGLSWLKQNTQIGMVFSPKGHKQSTNHCLAGQNYSLGEITISVLHPMANQSVDDNNDSCVLLLEYAGRSILLTGDIEDKAERQLLRYYPDLVVDILQVPHHGSNTSSSIKFIEQMSPAIALNSSGYLNRYNFPDTEIWRRYEQNGSRFINTVEAGAIDLTISASGEMKLVLSRQQNPALWRRN